MCPNPERKSSRVNLGETCVARRGGVLGGVLLVLLVGGKPCSAQEQAQGMPQVISASSSQAGAVPWRIVQAVNESKLAVLRGNVHPLARVEFDRGAAPPSLPMQRMMLVLKRSPEQEAALAQLLDEQQDKSSPNYHKWLTPEQFGQQFGPSDADIQAVTSWLQSHGFQVAKVAKGRTVIEFSGVAAQVQEAFHTAIHKFVVNGEEHWANSSDPQIPTALTPVVAGVVTLHNFQKKPMYHISNQLSHGSGPGLLGQPNPSLTYSGNCNSNSLCYGLAPYDIATIYNVLPLWAATPAVDGTGQSIAIVGRSDINPQDVTNFRTYVLPPAGQTNPLTVYYDGPNPGIVSGDETESLLDVEWSGAIAKGATVELVVSASTSTSDGVVLSALYIVDNNLAPVMGVSYGGCERYDTPSESQFISGMWEQASAQGITVVVASGDQGSACEIPGSTLPAPALDGLGVSDLASTPYNVAVGGTDFDDFSNAQTYFAATNNPNTYASALSYIPETTLNDTCTNALLQMITGSVDPESNCNNSTVLSQAPVLVSLSGGGGGASAVYPKPSWQAGTGLGIPTDKMRDLPDISLFAGDGFIQNFYVICEADGSGKQGSGCPSGSSYGGFVPIGGTSASTQVFAGIMALVNQKTGQRQGNANYVLYKLASTQATASPALNCIAVSPGAGCTFYDVTKGSNAMPCATGSPDCTTTHAGDAYGLLDGYDAGTGYDLATGLGSVNVANLISKWAAFAEEPSTTTLTLSPTSITHGQLVSVGMSVAAGQGVTGTPTGSVSLVADTGPSGTEGVQGFTLAANGSASGTTNALPGGTYNVVAQYPGDGAFGPSASSPPISVAVNPENSQTFANLVTLDYSGNVTSFSANSATYGSGLFLLRVDVGDSAASVSPSTGISSECSKGLSNCPTGTITLTPSGASLPVATLPLNSGGYAEIPSLAAGTYAVSANYPGDSSYGPSSSAAQFNISRAPTTPTLYYSPSVQYGEITNPTVMLGSNSEGAAPTGTFAFFIDGAPAPGQVWFSGSPGEPGSSPPVYAWAQASTNTYFLSLGDHTLTGQYSGDANYAPTAISPTPITVTKNQPILICDVITYAILSQQVTLSAQLIGAEEGGVRATGTITFYDGTTALSGPITYTPWGDSGLTATTPFTPTTLGTHQISASYSGDSNYSPATGAPYMLTVLLGPDFSIISSGTTAWTVNAGQTATFPYAVIISPEAGFFSSVNLSCSLSASATTCSVIPPSITCCAAVSVSVTTTARSLLPTGYHQRPGPWRRTAPITLWATVVLLLLFLQTYRWQQRLALSVPVLVLVLLFLIAGCGGGSGAGGGGGGTPPPPPTQNGTPAGTYVITVTGTSGSLAHSTTLTLTVN